MAEGSMFGGNKVILVVEDEVPLQQVIKLKLERCGYIPLVARTVDDGLKLLEEETQIDMIWLDHYLFGEKTGIDLVMEVKKESSQWRDLPIFVVSNTVTQKKIQTYIDMGIQKYYTKAEAKLIEIINDIGDYLHAAGVCHN